MGQWTSDEPLVRPGAAGRRRAWWALVLVVTLLHAFGVRELQQMSSRLGEGDAEAPRRLEVDFVRELAPSTPPAAPSTRPVRPAAVTQTAEVVASAASAASAPLAENSAAAAMAAAASAPWGSEAPTQVRVEPSTQASAPTMADPLAAPLPQALAASASATWAQAPARAASVSTPAAPAAFEWPPSTRLSYVLTGYYRGPVEGFAQVQWLRRDLRYQVHLDVFIGPRFAPLVTRRMSSDGDITDQGLRPRRYDEETKVPLLEPRRLTVKIEPDRVLLAGGGTAPGVPGLQDSASQFVQMTWLFTTQPQSLRVGGSVEVPLALPRKVDRWVYDIAAEESVRTPVGTIAAFYVKPRRETPAPGDLAVEAWFAPSLQYLPVRIRIRQDSDTWIDLLMQTLPEQAER